MSSNGARTTERRIDAAQVREGAKVIELEAKVEALEAGLAAARKSAAAEKAKAADAERRAAAKGRGKKAAAAPDPGLAVAKAQADKLSAENERLRKFLRELKARVAASAKEKAEAVGVPSGKANPFVLALLRP